MNILVQIEKLCDEEIDMYPNVPWKVSKYELTTQDDTIQSIDIKLPKLNYGAIVLNIDLGIQLVYRRLVTSSKGTTPVLIDYTLNNYESLRYKNRDGGLLNDMDNIIDLVHWSIISINFTFNLEVDTLITPIKSLLRSRNTAEVRKMKLLDKWIQLRICCDTLKIKNHFLNNGTVLNLDDVLKHALCNKFEFMGNLEKTLFAKGRYSGKTLQFILDAPQDTKDKLSDQIINLMEYFQTSLLCKEIDKITTQDIEEITIWNDRVWCSEARAIRDELQRQIDLM
jgi:hypothetical protein